MSKKKLILENCTLYMKVASGIKARGLWERDWLIPKRLVNKIQESVAKIFPLFNEVATHWFANKHKIISYSTQIA